MNSQPPNYPVTAPAPTPKERARAIIDAYHHDISSASIQTAMEKSITEAIRTAVDSDRESIVTWLERIATCDAHAVDYTANEKLRDCADALRKRGTP